MAAHCIEITTHRSLQVRQYVPHYVFFINVFTFFNQFYKQIAHIILFIIILYYMLEASEWKTTAMCRIHNHLENKLFFID